MLRSIGGPVADATYAPPLSLSIAIAGTLFNLGFLIYFLHNTAQKIDADAVIGAISDELSDSIEDSKSAGTTKSPLKDFEAAQAKLEQANFSHYADLCATETGYIQMIETDDLNEIASAENLTVHITEKPSRFIIKGVPIGRAYANAPISEDMIAEITSQVVVGRQRTRAQDLEFSIAALVEVALRALSPGLNDPYTAITCIDRLSAGLASAMDTGLPQFTFCRDNRSPRVIISPVTYQGVFDTAFNAIRQDCRDKVSVVIRLLEVLDTLAYLAKTTEQKDAVKTHIERVVKAGKSMNFEDDDRTDFDERVQRLRSRLEKEDRS